MGAVLFMEFIWVLTFISETRALFVGIEGKPAALARAGSVRPAGTVLPSKGARLWLHALAAAILKLLIPIAWPGDPALSFCTGDPQIWQLVLTLAFTFYGT